MTDKLEKSEVMRRRMADRINYFHVKDCFCPDCELIHDNAKLGYSDAKEQDAESVVSVPTAWIIPGSERPLTPAPQAAEQEHATNSDMNVLVGRIDACMDAIGDIRRRLDESGDSIEDETRWVTDLSIALFVEHPNSCLSGGRIGLPSITTATKHVIEALRDARAAVRKERES